MRNTFFILSNSICISCLFLLLSSSQAGEKTAPKVHTIEIRQMKFQPAELTVKKGDIVVWVNRDIVPHDVTEASKKAWSSSALTTGKSWRMVVTKSYDYYCSIHVVMKGRLVVK